MPIYSSANYAWQFEFSLVDHPANRDCLLIGSTQRKRRSDDGAIGDLQFAVESTYVFNADQLCVIGDNRAISNAASRLTCLAYTPRQMYAAK